MAPSLHHPLTLLTMGESMPWEKLFVPASPGASCRTFPMRLIRRGGHPFLLLPNSPRLATKGLELYAPQTRSARWARCILATGLRCGLLTVLKKAPLNLAENDPFAHYLQEQAGTDAAHFALLVGNPNTRGQRCIFLLLDQAGNAVGVVKAGAGPDATALIAHEEAFLKKVPAATPGIPRLRSSYASDRVRALAFDFFRGAVPAKDDWATAGNVLSLWVNSNFTVDVEDLAVWHRLLAAAGRELPAKLRELETSKLCPAIFHGDFAPWNMRRTGGEWMMVDWERAELTGPPLWDWLHFIIQPAILVERAAPEAIVHRLRELFQLPLFVEYAAQARIQGLEWPLVHAYLHYCLHVVRQTEGLDGVRVLAESAPLEEMIR